MKSHRGFQDIHLSILSAYINFKHKATVVDARDVPMNVTVLLHLQLLHEKTTYQDFTSEASALFTVSANAVHHNAPIKIYTPHQNLCF